MCSHLCSYPKTCHPPVPVPLQEARGSGERVIVCSHLCIHPKTCHGACLLYNYPVVLEVGSPQL